MAQPAWYNLNAHRRYPFQDRTSDLPLPDHVIVDFGCLFGPAAGFRDGADYVYLEAIRQIDSVIHFYFRCTAPGLQRWHLVFIRKGSEPPTADTDYRSEFVRAIPRAYTDVTDGAIDVLRLPCQDTILWEGFLTTGPSRGPDGRTLGELLTAAGDLWTWSTAPPQIEPALLQNLGALQVQTLSLANLDRTRAVAPPGCGPASSSAGTGERTWIVQQRALQETLRLKEGYNLQISQKDTTSTLRLRAQVGAGAGQPCAEVPLSDEEALLEPPYDGAVLCDDLITSINGLGGPVLQIHGGTGVRVYPDPLREAVLIVDVDLHGLAICRHPPDAAVSSSSSLVPGTSSSSSILQE